MVTYSVDASSILAGSFRIIGSDLPLEEIIMNNIFNETIETLIKDAQALQNRYDKSVQLGNTKESLDSLRLLKDTLSLIKEYDWNLKYSAEEKDYYTEVMIWEENHCGEKRNEIKWDIHKNQIDSTYWENYFRKFIVSGESKILSNGDDFRGTGKTTALLKLCNSYGGCFVYKHRGLSGIQNRMDELGIVVPSICFRERVSMPYRFIFIDEAFKLSDEEIDYLKKDHVVIGFR